ncbi:MAG: hypothetical protein M1838_000444 [Thelocarpon superellum]|nr:MAG: hypothetical protein M1838_000444 [Thelocarpon superellum]
MVPQFADRYGRQKEAQLWRVNVEGTRNVLAASKAAGVKALVYTSSIAVLFDDLSRDFLNVDETVPVADHSLVYGESKAAAEKLVLAASSPSLLTCALRPSMILGPGDPSTIPPFHGCIARGETPWAIGSGDNLCDFTYVDNVADAHVLAGEKLLSALSSSSDHTTIINSSTTSDTEFPAGDATHVNPLAGEAIYITNGQPIAFRTFCLAIWAEFGHVPAFQVRIPEGLASVLGLVSEWWTWLTRSSSALNRGSVRDACATRYADISKARRLLGYQPRVDLVDGAYKEQLGQQEEEP